MKGLDTNVLVRYLVKDDKQQAEKASAYIHEAAASGENCFIGNIVLCELVWVLESAYDFGKQDISDVLEKILITKQFEIEQKDIVRQAIKDYSNGKGDLADYLIGRINHGHGCGRTATFDRSLRDMPIFELLES